MRDGDLPRLTSGEVPQANSLERVVGLLRFRLKNPSGLNAPGFRHLRDLSYYLQACRILQLTNAEDAVTALGRSVAAAAPQAVRRALADAFVGSTVGSAWLRWKGASDIRVLEPASANAFLAECSELPPAMRSRRASTLGTWVKWLVANDAAHPKKDRDPHTAATEPQLALASYSPALRAASNPAAWPSPHRFPHNEGGASVWEVVSQDLGSSTSVLLVVGYASLDRVVEFIAGREFGEPTEKVRLLFGWEPFEARHATFRSHGQSVAEEVRDYWLARGISVSLSGTLIRIRELVEQGRVEVRIGAAGRPVHAKIYLAAGAVTLGSSNFTHNGLRRQSEANVRISRDEGRRYREAEALAEGIWAQGEDYQDGFLALLDALLRRVTWQEALARGCAAVLEGEWARKYVPPDLIASLTPPLWPHQLQGISQALWILENVGSVLVSDATGSGKTRMGAWLIRGAFDRQYRMGGRPPNPMVVAPPQVVEQWEERLQETALALQVHSHGPLSNPNAMRHARLTDAIAETELLAVDEAHNFLNWSDRTRRIVSHYADNVLLFTATPINKGAADLLALVELLGADNLPETCLEALTQLRRGARNGWTADRVQLSTLREHIRSFTVRRTRSDLNTIAASRAPEYALPGGTSARYPRHEARYYGVECRPRDLELAAEIACYAERLKGITRIGGALEVPRGWEGTEETYARRVVASARALARYHVMKCLRSSRAALYEHVRGTAAAFAHFAAHLDGHRGKGSTGDMVGRTLASAGQVPEWRLRQLDRRQVEPWLWDAEAHRRTCEEEADTYDAIGRCVLQLSDDRERAKLDWIVKLSRVHTQVLAYDSHFITLKLFHHALSDRDVNVTLLTGAGGEAAKRRARASLGRDARSERLVALCSDAFSEGLNLQSASCVVHLDTPTVIRTAEQRAGRVDRMDSRHAQVEIWWPRDPAAFAPQRRDLLRERHEVVSDLLGANLQLPDEQAEGTPADTEPLDVTILADRAHVDRGADSLELSDAFWGVRSLIGSRALVSPSLYEHMRTSQAEVVACVSVVRSDAPWAFLVVGGLDREAPRWVFLDGLEGSPEADLRRVAQELRERLAPSTQDAVPDDAAQALVAHFARRLQGEERQLLPQRRQRALALLERVLDGWIVQAERNMEVERRHALAKLRSSLFPSSEDQEDLFPDPRSVADAWLRVIRPRIKQALAARRNRRRIWRLSDLHGALLRDPIELVTLERAFAGVPLLEPVDRRILAMIVGVPGRGPDESELPGTTG